MTCIFYVFTTPVTNTVLTLHIENFLDRLSYFFSFFQTKKAMSNEAVWRAYEAWRQQFRPKLECKVCSVGCSKDRPNFLQEQELKEHLQHRHGFSTVHIESSR